MAEDLEIIYSKEPIGPSSGTHSIKLTGANSEVAEPCSGRFKFAYSEIPICEFSDEHSIKLTWKSIGGEEGLIDVLQDFKNLIEKTITLQRAWMFDEDFDEVCIYPPNNFEQNTLDFWQKVRLGYEAHVLDGSSGELPSEKTACE